MQKIAFLFSGQGSQYVGMSKDLIDKYKIFSDTLDEASSYLDFDIKNMIINGSREEIDISENAQPLIISISVATMRLLNHEGIFPDVTAGLSLGEYSAHVASKSLSFANAVPLVQKRGRFMNEEVPVGTGGMIALLNCDLNLAREICQEAQQFGVVEIANYNSETQIVISGEKTALEHAQNIAKSKNIKKTIPLSVSAPFHSSLLIGAGEKLKKEIKKITINEMTVPILANVTADYIKDKNEIPNLLVQQVYSCVRFHEILKKITSEGIDTLIEVGPGKIISGLLKKIDKNLNTFSADNSNDLDTILKNIKV